MKSIISVMLFCLAHAFCCQSAVAQDVGAKDSVKFVTEDWLIQSAGDSLMTLGIYGWTDAKLGAVSVGMKANFYFQEFDADRWKALHTYIYSLGRYYWSTSVDSLIRFKEFQFDGGMTALVKTWNKTTLDTSAGGIGFNGGLVGLIDYDTSKSVLPQGSWSKIGEFLLSIDLTRQNAMPVEFKIVVDSNFFPPAGSFKFSPRTGTGYPPAFRPDTIYVSANSPWDAEEQHASSLVPQSYELAQNYPNPFNPTTTISFYVEQQGHVELDIFNILGRKVKTLVSGNMDPGWQETVWDGTDSSGDMAASGIYFYRLRAGDFVSTKKMVLVK